jgi:CDP-glucose 4,6-dehydratase
VPDAMRAFAAGRPLAVRNPASIRPWQHVLEPLAGYLVLAERLVTDGAAFARAWNFAPADDLVLPVGELVAKLVDAWGPGAAWTSGAEVGAPHEAKLLRLDASLARAQLGWRPTLTIDAALEWIVEWHRAVAGGADARVQCEAQLARYV